MPAPAAESHHATQVAKLLHQHGAKHLRTRKYGAAVIVESGPPLIRSSSNDSVAFMRSGFSSCLVERLG